MIRQTGGSACETGNTSNLQAGESEDVRRVDIAAVDAEYGLASPDRPPRNRMALLPQRLDRELQPAGTGLAWGERLKDVHE